MELDWTTFLLELMNFAVLLWVLNRFLYRPVMNVIAERKRAIQQTLSDAERTRSEAQALQSQYENRLEEWEREREKARVELRAEMSAERIRLLEHLRIELEQEREKAAVVEHRRRKDFSLQAETAALVLGGTFVSRLLSRLGGLELERKIIDLVRQDLSELPHDQLRRIRESSATIGGPITITSAYPLDTARRDQLSQACRTLAGREVSCEFLVDQTLVSGLRISIGSWVLRANIQDEMHFFAESSRHA